MLAEVVVFSIRCGPREVPPVLPNLVRGLPLWREICCRARGVELAICLPLEIVLHHQLTDSAHEPVRGERPNRLAPPMKTYSRKPGMSRKKNKKISQCRTPPTPISNLFACVLLEPPRRLLESRLKVEVQV
ncbi:hypothetical protein PspLS_08865 [Pyricularia sp. CBS 133598]|nr:hypothetical protein PspLS_08865 [Pyricularia sp. CBS 133598]